MEGEVTTRGSLPYGLWLGMLLVMLAGCGGTTARQAMPVPASPTQVPVTTITRDADSAAGDADATGIKRTGCLRTSYYVYARLRHLSGL